MATLRSNLTQIALQAPEKASEALLQTAHDIYDLSQQLVPTDTTSLKLSGGIEVIDSSTVQVGYGAEGEFIGGRKPAEYVLPVEFGSENSAAQPFFIPAFVQNEETYKARLQEAMESLG